MTTMNVNMTINNINVINTTCVNQVGMSIASCVE